MRIGLAVLIALWLLAASLPGEEAVDRAAAEGAPINFTADVQPILAEYCAKCHGSDDKTREAELRLDVRERALKGGSSGEPAIVPGKPEESLLIRAIQRQADVSAMPPEKENALRPDQVADFISWVKAGAVWPAKSAKFEATKHWSLEPVRKVAAPKMDPTWGKSSIDAFIGAKQKAAGVVPAPEADKLTLIRRATFDLTGLPPTPDEVAAFLGDDTPHAFETVVERLLVLNFGKVIGIGKPDELMASRAVQGIYLGIEL